MSQSGLAHTQVPPPQSAVQITSPVCGSQSQLDGLQPSSVSHILLSGQPLCTQPGGTKSSHRPGPVLPPVVCAVVPGSPVVPVVVPGPLVVPGPVVVVVVVPGSPVVLPVCPPVPLSDVVAPPVVADVVPGSPVDPPPPLDPLPPSVVPGPPPPHASPNASTSAALPRVIRCII
jgi:hypothetical protein